MAKPPLLTSGNRRPSKRRYPSLPTMQETPADYHARKQKEYANKEEASEESISHGEQVFQREVMSRLRRVETRLVSGLSSLGASMVNHREGIDVFTAPTETADGTVTIISLGTTVKDILDALGNTTGTFDIVYNGKIKCQITTGEEIL